HVRACGKRLDVAEPGGEALLALALVAPDAERRADMVEHDRRLRKCTCEVDEIRELRLEQPSVEREAKPVPMPEAFAECGIAIHALRITAAERSEHARILVVRRGVANAAKAAMARGNVRAQHVFGGVTDAQIDVADDAGAGADVAIDAARG